MQPDSALIDPKQFARYPWLEYVFVFDAVLAQIVSQAGSNYVLSILKVLQEYYGTDDDSRAWFMSSFALAVGTFIIISGRLGDVYGIKLVTTIGYLWTFVWAILGGVAYWVKNPIFFYCCRAFQGIGCGLLLPNLLAAVGRTYKHGTFRKHFVFSLIGWAAPVGGCFGPLFAGLIAVKTHYWNWICWSYAIALFIGALLTIIACPKFETIPQSMDWIGTGLLISGLVLFNFVWNQAPLAGWKNPYIIVLLIIGVVFLVLFTIWELKFAENPIIPVPVIKNSRLLLCVLALFFCWGTFGITIFNFYNMNLFFRNYSALGAGAANMAGPVSGGVAAISCSLIIRKIPVEFVFVFSMACFCGSALIVATLPVHQTYWRNSFATFILAPFGMDFSFPSAMIILSDSLPLHHQGICSSLVMTAINYGIAEFVGMSGTIEKQVLLNTGDRLLALRASQYLGVGLSGIGMIIAVALFVFYRTKPHHDEEQNSETSQEKSSELSPVLSPELSPEISIVSGSP